MLSVGFKEMQSVKKLASFILFYHCLMIFALPCFCLR